MGFVKVEDPTQIPGLEAKLKRARMRRDLENMEVDEIYEITDISEADLHNLQVTASKYGKSSGKLFSILESEPGSGRWVITRLK